MDVSGSFLNWLNSYICNSLQIVKTNDFISNKIFEPPHSSIPQDEHISFFFFNADDYKLFFFIKSANNYQTTKHV